MILCACGHDFTDHYQTDVEYLCILCSWCDGYTKAAANDSATAPVPAGGTPEGLAREKVEMTDTEVKSSPITEAGRELLAGAEIHTERFHQWRPDLQRAILAIEQQSREGGYSSGLLEGRREAVREGRSPIGSNASESRGLDPGDGSLADMDDLDEPVVHETVTLDPPHPAYWRHILTEVIYNAIHHPPGGPKNVPSGQIAEAVVARLLRAASPLDASESPPPRIDKQRLALAVQTVHDYDDDYEAVEEADEIAAAYAGDASESPPIPKVCQCGHTREQHESHRTAPGHCTHRCLPPWLGDASESGQREDLNGPR